MPPKDKKTEKKDKPVEPALNAIEIVVILLIITALLGTLLPLISGYISSGEISFFGIKLFKIYNFFISSTPFLRFFAFVFAGVFAVGTFIFNRKADAIWAEEKEKMYPENYFKYKDVPSVVNREPINQKWQEIKKKSESTQEGDWRIAIIEADIMLDSLLEKLNLPGMTIGDKLKAIEPSDFLTLDNAWEAHKARNKIAHQGSDFLLNQREVARIISLYQSVFEEFKII